MVDPTIGPIGHSEVHDYYQEWIVNKNLTLYVGGGNSLISSGSTLNPKAIPTVSKDRNSDQSSVGIISGAVMPGRMMQSRRDTFHVNHAVVLGLQSRKLVRQSVRARAVDGVTFLL